MIVRYCFKKNTRFTQTILKQQLRVQNGWNLRKYSSKDAQSHSLAFIDEILRSKTFQTSLVQKQWNENRMINSPTIYVNSGNFTIKWARTTNQEISIVNRLEITHFLIFSLFIHRGKSTYLEISIFPVSLFDCVRSGHEFASFSLKWITHGRSIFSFSL